MLLDRYMCKSPPPLFGLHLSASTAGSPVCVGLQCHGRLVCCPGESGVIPYIFYRHILCLRTITLVCGIFSQGHYSFQRCCKGACADIFVLPRSCRAAWRIHAQVVAPATSTHANNSRQSRFITRRQLTRLHRFTLPRPVHLTCCRGWLGHDRFQLHHGDHPPRSG